VNGKRVENYTTIGLHMGCSGMDYDAVCNGI
jgi:hypothetical protein